MKHGQSPGEGVVDVNLVETIAEELRTDPTSTELRSGELELIWKQASLEERQVISLVLNVLCGWSAEYLLLKSGELQRLTAILSLGSGRGHVLRLLSALPSRKRAGD